MGIKHMRSTGLTAGCRQQRVKHQKQSPGPSNLRMTWRIGEPAKEIGRSSGRGQRRANIGNVLEAKRSKVHPVFL